MGIPREKLSKNRIPIFNIWVAACNLTLILISSIWYVSDSTNLGDNPGLSFGIVIGINILSLLLLIPMFTMKEIPRFLIPALGWFIMISIVYAILGLYLFLILGTVQLAADIWFDFVLKKVEST